MVDRIVDREWQQIELYGSTFRWVFFNSRLPWWLSGKEPTWDADVCWIPGLGRSLGEGHGNLLQYSCLGNPMDRGAWQLLFLGSQRVGHGWANNTFFSIVNTRVYRVLPATGGRTELGGPALSYIWVSPCTPLPEVVQGSQLCDARSCRLCNVTFKANFYWSQELFDIFLYSPNVLVREGVWEDYPPGRSGGGWARRGRPMRGPGRRMLRQEHVWVAAGLREPWPASSSLPEPGLLRTAWGPETRATGQSASLCRRGASLGTG